MAMAYLREEIDDYAHSQEDGYNEALKAFYNKQEFQKP